MSTRKIAIFDTTLRDGEQSPGCSMKLHDKLLVAGNLDGAYIETVVAQSYAQNYPELKVLLDVPYDQEGSVVGVSKGNAALLEGVNRAIAAVLADGTMDQFVTEANELASGTTYEGLLDENGEAASAEG